jgi:hypothetical protein
MVNPNDPPKNFSTIQIVFTMRQRGKQKIYILGLEQALN